MTRWSGVAVYDADQCFMGVVAGTREGLGDFSDGRVLPSDEKSLRVREVPEGYWRITVALEHGSIGSWRTLPKLGVDILSLGQSVIDSITGPRLRGASTLPQLLAGSLQKFKHGSDEGWFRRKVNELLDGAAIYSAYWHGEDNDAFRRLVADFLPHAQSTLSGRGGAIYGIGIASQVLWGVRPENLSLAQQAVLAAAIKYPTLLAPRNDAPGRQRSADFFAKVKQRAIYGLRQAYGDDPQLQDTIAEIEAMQLPEPRLCSALEKLLPEDPAKEFRIRFNPAVRAEYFAAEELAQAVAELREVAGPEFRETVAGITLSTHARENMPFKRAVAARLARLDSKLSTSPIALTRVSASVERPIGDVLFAAADEAGQLRLFYQVAERPVLGKPQATGSIAKILAALVRADAGDTPTARYCNKRIDDRLGNADGDKGTADCRSPHALYTAIETFRASKNLPVFHALRSVGEDRLLALLNLAGFQPYPATPLRTAIAFGMTVAAPANMMRLMTSVARGTRNEPATAKSPRMIAEIEWRQGTVAPPNAESVAIDLSPYFRRASAAQYVKSVLSAPMQPGGTAHSLSKCQDAGAWSLAKTGTDAANGRIFGKLLLMSGRPTGQEYMSLIALVAHPTPLIDIGRVVNATTLAAAVCDGLHALPPPQQRSES
jgi:hypothetical protein